MRHNAFPVPASLEKKCRTLEEVLAAHSPIGIAYSGGVDSTFLAWYAHEVLEKEMHAFFAVSPLISERELRSAIEISRKIGIIPQEIRLDPTAIPLVRENTPMRCYHCKREIMGRISRIAREAGCSTIADGSHAGDKKDHRPGAKALQELGIISPLAMAGLDKPDIRELSRLARLPTWDKPSQSCLATRVPYGTDLSLELLRQIEQAETVLWDLGCEQVRVRSHGNLARIEVNEDAFPLLLESTARDNILSRFSQLGFAHISLDLAGFRSGCWDEALKSGPQ